MQRSKYAAQLVPVLDASVRLFDQTSSGVSTSADLSQLVPLCTNDGNQIATLETRADGVPHPYAWYSPVGTFHHQVLGVYHYMLGALEQCQTAGDSQDSAEAAGSIADVATAARQLHQIDGRAHAFASGR
jgi:hypothetical protein